MLIHDIRNILDNVSNVIDKSGKAKGITATPGAEMGEDDQKLVDKLVKKAFKMIQANGAVIEPQDISTKPGAVQQRIEKPLLGEFVDNFHASICYDLVVYCAECSLKSNLIDIALKCLTYFFASCSCKTDEYYVRAHYCQAEYEAVLALRKSLKGDVRLKHLFCSLVLFSRNLLLRWKRVYRTL